MSDVVMPRLSDSMEEGTILTWLKRVGDEVAVGEELVEIETDKANMAYEADVAGTLNEILAQEGETLPIGSPIARIGEPGEKAEGPRAAGPVPDEGPSSSQAAGEDPSSAPPAAAAAPSSAEAPAAAVETAEGQRIKASPLARRLAKERGLDLSQVAGSGPGGRIVKSDVEKAEIAPAGAPAAAQGSPETAKGEVRIQELTKAQQVVARRMAESKATAPHFYLTAEIDMSKAVAARSAIKAAAKEGDLVPSFNDMVVKACAIALTEFPKANGAYRDGRYELYSRVNIGVAVALEEGLVVPTVFDAERKGLRQIASETRALAAKVRDGSITPPELSGGTFAVSNLGMFGIEEFAAVINSPQAGILAVGAIREAPAVRGGEIVAAQLMKVTLSCDHRILYGAEGAGFLARVKQLLEEPVGLAL
ncbi:MAG TPA: dihydrolipoamide acetyltransferase family protein [Solirubrobacterales bacterium]|jgi:pyruvate dehydrogenase E2 component (dihydrolipoamide acetyltransferase)|nr:dihydrolipoamide acetyltransferase family protein [Solirubrobacterales bacterium]